MKEMCIHCGKSAVITVGEMVYGLENAKPLCRKCQKEWEILFLSKYGYKPFGTVTHQIWKREFEEWLKKSKEKVVFT